MSNEGLQLEIYPYPSYSTPIGRISARRAPQFLEELKNVGGGSFTISRNDPKLIKNPSWLKGRNLIKIIIDNVVVGGFIVNGRIADTIGSGEKREDVYRLSGEGLKILFDDSEVRPYGGLKATSGDTRSFSWASEAGSWYVPGEWSNPVSMGRVLTKYKFYAPDKWPTDARFAYWIWGVGGDSSGFHPGGDNYFRLTIPVTTKGTYKLYLAVDDYYDLYVDGAKKASTDRITTNYIEAKTFSFEFDPGTHVIGIRAVNKDAGGPGGVAAAIYRLRDRIPPTTVGAFTTTIGTNPTATRAGHGLTTGTRVYLTTTGTLPSGLEQNKDYYITSATTNTFKLAKSKGGPTIATTGSQSGVHTIHRQEIAEKENLVSYSGASLSVLNTQLTQATNTVTSRLNTYNSLPAGSTTGNNAQKKQAKAKANAKAAWQKAVQVRSEIQAIYDAISAGISSGVTWRSMAYPNPVPGWTPGEIILTLLNEAEARGVISAGLLTPTFTSSVDSAGNPWSEPVEWTFGVGESLLSVITKMEELVCDVWIDAENYELNIVNQRGEDRTVFQYDVDGVTVLKAPIVFRRSKNVRSASIESKSKIKNSLSLKTEKGWLATPEVDSDSIEEYGVLEGSLDTDASVGISKQLAQILFGQKAIEEEGADYDVFIPPEGKHPWKDFFPGDWVLAPNEQNILVPRRIMSSSVEDDASGRPNYTFEFDTIFRDNEDRLNRVVGRLGGGGIGSSSMNAGGIGAVSPLNPIIVGGGGTAPTYSAIPQAPADLEIFTIGTWTADGVYPRSQVNLIWEPVTATTNDEEIVPDRYEVWGKLTEEDDDTYELMASVTEPKATIEPFSPLTEWTFKVYAWLGDRESASSDEISVTMAGPNEPLLAPDPPTLSSELGLLTVTWNGLINGDTPPPHFRYVYAEVAPDIAGPYSQMGPVLQRDGRNITISSLTKGEDYWVRLVAVDGVGIASPPSGTATTIITGIDLGSLEDDVAAAIEAAQEAGDNAEAAVEVLETWVGEIEDTANAAVTIAGTATKITRSTDNPSGTGEANQVWQKIDANKDVVGEWYWTGSIWQEQLIKNDRISNLDAGKVTFGTMSGDRISAKTLDVTKLIVGDLTNLLLDPNFEFGTQDWTGDFIWPAVTGAVRSTRAGELPSSDVTDKQAIGVDFIPAPEGAQFFMEAEMYAPGVIGTSRFGIQFYDDTKVAIGTPAWAYENTASISWLIVGGKVEAPVASAYAKPIVMATGVPSGSRVIVTGMVLRRMQAGEMIVDGAITAQKIAAEEILGIHIGAKAIDAEHINSEAIISEHIGAEIIKAKHIGAEEITADKIKAGSITVNELSPSIGDDLVLTANNTITLIAGRIDDVETSTQNTADNLELMQTYYEFGPDGANITKPGSPFSIRIGNDVIQMLENGNVVSYWNSGTMYVNQLEATSVVVGGNHQIEQYGNGTVVRDL